MTNARALTESLGGRWYRRYGLACCPAHGDQKPSLSIGEGSDGKLLLSCKSGCSFTEVVTACRDLGAIDGNYRPIPPGAAEIVRREAEARADAERTERKALATWQEALPISGTPAEAYLRNRGVTCAMPDTLRFHPECWHPTARRFPAMVARVDGLPRLAIHRTYLRPDGSGKADVDPVKAMQGTCAGGAVRLSSAQGSLVIAEGIETALSLASGLLRAPATIWAALSASGIAGLQLSDTPGRLTVAADGDSAGHEAAHKLGERAAALGWQVSLLPAPQGRDWNDILLTNGAET